MAILFTCQIWLEITYFHVGEKLFFSPYYSFEFSSSLKGQQREMAFWLNPFHLVQIKRIFEKLKFVLLLTEIYKLLCLLAYSPNTPRVSLRLLHVCIDSVYRKQPYISRILHIRLNTFLVFSILRIRRKNEEYAERNFHLKKSPGTLKGHYFKRIGRVR